jgi:hypothetical protein
MSIPLQIINNSELIEDSELSRIIAAVQVQVSSHFAPIWGKPATLSLVPRGKAADDRQWWITVLDHPEAGSAKGYADLTSRGMPLGRVYVKATKQFGSSLSVALSQEVMGMLTDPHLMELRMNQDGTIAFALEVCTPVEPQRYGYDINGVLVSDFVFPSWFEESAPGPYDYTGHCRSAFHILKGGHITALNLTEEPRSWAEVTADGHDTTSRKQEGSRLHQRAKFRGNGRRSLSMVS